VRIERLRKEHGVRIKWVHFPLHPDTPQEGRSLEDLFAGRGYDIPKMQAQMRARMEAEGLPYGTRTMTYNSRLAQELAKWAETQDGGTAIHDALYRAYFVDGLNIAQIGNLMAVTRQLGLPEEEARDTLTARRFQAAVDADWQRCRDFGITAVPTFVVGNQGVVGAQPYEVLESLVVEGGAEKP